jgi:ubiquinone/menaquinone biosynthesis C-methylase UbiE
MKKALKKLYRSLQDNNAPNRNTWVETTLKSIPENQSILDAGAGEQRYKHFCGHLNYTSQDFCQYDGTGNEAGLQSGKWNTSKIDIVSDIANIPVEGESYDCILCTEVLEHIPYPIEAIKEFKRILKPQGKLILTVPCCSLTHMAPHYYYTGFSEFFLQKILAENGFDNISISKNGNYFDYMAQEVWRFRYVMKKYYKRGCYYFLLCICRLATYFILKRVAPKGANSAELLCYGFHVIAQKTS